MATFGEKLCELMAERQISQRKLSNLVPCDDGYVSRLVRGLRMPSEEMAARFDEILGADGSLAALRPDPPKPKRSGAAAAGTVMLGINPDLWDDDMERRALLQLAALGMSAGALGSTGEPVRQLLALALNSEPRGVDEWHLTLADRLYAILTRPPAQARDGLMVDLVAAQRQIQAAEPGAPGEAIELRRIVAALSMMYADTLTRLGDHDSAIHWWRTAKAAADMTGDLDLRLMVRCEEAEFGLYGQRDPAIILQLIDAAERLAGPAPSCRKADLAGTRAKVLTLQGRHGEARAALDSFTDSAGGQARGGILPTHRSENVVHFTASWVHAGAGRESEADEKREIVLANTRGYQYAANVRLHEALCTVVNGGIDRGARQAAEILAALPPSRRSHMITETGKAVVRAVPVERRDRPAVRELCALTSSPHL
ncbi:helix-turn-helix domain-containing protein [Actinomadura macra]|uniref:helix-turn-helix domain-containing protein n=1 Tax=Actinomadura macra TaxID=46164 RepID=UPI000836E108|nr:helix-turn-helix transcriptional regulator [Actinomadura macra]